MFRLGFQTRSRLSMQVPLLMRSASNASRHPGAKDANGVMHLKGLSLPEMEQWFQDELGEKAFRARQMWEWIYKPQKLSHDLAEMHDVSVALRTRLAGIAQIDSLVLDRVHTAADGTRKLVFELERGGKIEAVVIPATSSSGRRRNTLCISSQLGCAMNCQFCFTAKMGLHAHLSTAEIVDQVVQAQRLLRASGESITNVVFMGMGEPLHNVDNVIRATGILLHEKGLNMSHNKVTVSTSGLVPAIRRFCRESRACLAVSLNGTDNDVRTWIMPVNRKHPIEELMQTLREEFPRGTGGQEKVLLEYVMLRGVNDTAEDSTRLVKLAANVPCKVNLIPFNPHPGSEFLPSHRQDVLNFRDYLVSKGMVCTVRESRGDYRMAACGQLGEGVPKAGTRPPPKTHRPGSRPPRQPRPRGGEGLKLHADSLVGAV